MKCQCDFMTAQEKLTAPNVWTLRDIIAVCVLVESICPKFGCHVALTGGLLYKVGTRKDADILFYRIRQAEEIKWEEMFEALEKVGFSPFDGFGWCFKTTFDGKPIDVFFPEEVGGIYETEENPLSGDDGV